MLTYETLRNFMVKEKASKKLEKIPEDFFEQVRTYLEGKEKIKGKDDFWELENAKRTLQDILELRELKLLEMAHFNVKSGVVPEGLTKVEDEFFNKTVEGIKQFQKYRKAAIGGEKEELALIGILRDVPEFVGIDMKAYGPLKEGDVASLPEENAILLVGQKSAKLINTGQE